ncbi:MAG TPA: DUF1254 domain-containing protein [Stellaceae bacterium]|nr:DUF1254 domain-containing protein [Stellaceae bacterium]
MKQRIRRRTVVAGLGAVGALGAAPASVAAGGLGEDAFTAFLFVLPLIEMARARVLVTTRRRDGLGGQVNAIAYGERLAGPDARAVTTPNNDTLYASAFVDLTEGPLTVVLPETGSRYFSVAVLDMYTNVAILLGTRTTGGAGGTYRLIGPQEQPQSDHDLRLATPHGWLMARILVAGEADLPVARRIEAGLTLSGPAVPPPALYATRGADWPDYFRSAQRLLDSDPPTFKVGLDAVERVRRAGARGDFDRAGYSAEDARAIDAGVARARALVQSASGRGRFIDGWTYPPAELGNFGDHFILRAVVAVAGLAALPREEAMYMRAAGDDGGGLFHGDGLYRFTLARPIPVAAFWSLSMYEATPDGQFFFTPNALDRYAIGDRTPGLRRNADGSLDIWIGRRDPGDERRANWLPASAKGPFALTLRAYLPKAELLDGRYRLPAITAAAG